LLFHAWLAALEGQCHQHLKIEALKVQRHCTSSGEPANGLVLTLDAPPTIVRAAAEFFKVIFTKEKRGYRLYCSRL
jgi:hypothetical protein